MLLVGITKVLMIVSNCLQMISMSFFERLHQQANSLQISMPPVTYFDVVKLSVVMFLL